MFIAYIVATLLAAAANLFSATYDFVRYKQVSIAMYKAGGPESWPQHPPSATYAVPSPKGKGASGNRRLMSPDYPSRFAH